MRIYTFLAVFLLSSFILKSQEPLVITKQNMLITEGTLDWAFISTSNLPSVMIPEIGTNKSWDYSSINISNQGVVSSTLKLPTESFFLNSSNFVLEDLSVDIVANRGFDYDEYYSYNDEGYKAIGYGVKNQAYFIGDLTGGPMDSIVFKKQNKLFNTPRTAINFPLTYEDVVISEYSMSVDFTISITPYGLTNAPATKVTHHEQNDSVIGWGKLVVPHVKDGNGASVPYDVLLVKRVTTSLDSLYLYGQPAPEALLTAFGLVQGSISTKNRLMFIRANSRALLLSMDLDNSMSNVTAANYDLNTVLSSTSINISDEINSDLVVFPNPVKNNLNIRLSDGINGAFKLSIIDIYGNSVFNSHFESNTYSLELPNNITNGTYFARVSDETGRIISKSKIIVNK